MQFPDKVYYSIESLLFLYNFEKGGPWKSDEIAKVICLSNDIKHRLKNVNTIGSLRSELEKIEISEIVNFKTIKDVLGRLSSQQLIKGKPGQGYEINTNGKCANIAEIIHLFDLIGLTACSHSNPSFQCPKINTKKCCSYPFYNIVSGVLRDIFENTTIEQIANRNWKHIEAPLKKLKFRKKVEN